MATGNFFVDKTRTVTLQHVYQGLEKPDATEFKANSLIWDRQTKGWFTNPSGAWVAATFSGSQFTLADLTDATTTGVSDGDAFVYDAETGQWKPGVPSATATTLQGLSNVSTSSPSDGQALVYDSGTSKWGPSSIDGGSGSSTLGGLSDVTIVSPVDKDILYYDSSTSTWRREPFSTQETFSSNSDVLNLVRPYIDSTSGSGYVSSSGSTTLDLSTSRAFLLTATNDIALTFSNIPSGNDYATSWTVAVKQDATGGRATTLTNTVTALYGEALTDLNTDANAVNLLWFIRIAGVTYWTLYYNESVALEPTTGFFAGSDPETVARPFARAEQVDLANVTHRALDGTAGAGTLSFEKNGVSVTGLTSFAVNDVLSIIRSGSTVASCISIPGYLT